MLSRPSVFDFRDDLDVGCIVFFQNFSDSQYIARATHEARCDKVDVIFDSEDNIFRIFLCNSREIRFDSWKIDTFFVFQNAWSFLIKVTISLFSLVDFSHFKVDQAVIQ